MYGKFCAFLLALAVCSGSAFAAEFDGTAEPVPSPSTDVPPAAVEVVPEIVPEVPAKPVPDAPVSDPDNIDGSMGVVPGEDVPPEAGMESVAPGPVGVGGDIYSITVPPTPVGYDTVSPDTVSYAAAEAGTMSDVVVRVFGPYTPKTQTVTAHNSDGTSHSYEQIVPGVAGLDWPWIVGVSLFALTLFSFFKLLGLVVKHG